jgi:small subunit ribosomal protein S20
MSERSRVINGKTMSEIRHLERKVIKAIDGKNKDESSKALVAFMSKIGKAAQKGRIHTSTASRKVGRLSKRVAAL